MPEPAVAVEQDNPSTSDQARVSAQTFQPPDIGFQDPGWTTLKYSPTQTILLEPSETGAIREAMEKPDTEVREALTEVAQGLVPPSQTSTVVEVLMGERQPQAIGSEITLINSTPETTDSGEAMTHPNTFSAGNTRYELTDDGGILYQTNPPARESTQAEEILRIGAIAYAHAGSRGQIQQEGDNWTAHGTHYDLVYSPSDKSFQVSGKDTAMKVVAIDGQIDLSQTRNISSTDIERFQATETILETRDVAFKSQSPEQTYLLAKDARDHQVDGLIQNAHAILNCVGTQDEKGTLFNGRTYTIQQNEGLTVEARGRGEILNVSAEGEIQCSATKDDFEKFASFAATLDQKKLVASEQPSNYHGYDR